MSRTWILDTETKGTGAQMVPLDKVVKQPESKPLFVPRKRQPKPPPEPAPRPPRRFKVVDISSRAVLAEDTDAPRHARPPRRDPLQRRRQRLRLGAVDRGLAAPHPAREAAALGAPRARATNLASMAYSTEEARVQLLDDIAHAIDELGVALAALGAAYELLDERTADQLEEELFRPVQVAYGRAQRTHAGFAERHGLPGRTFEPSVAGRVSQGARSFVDTAAEAVGETEHLLAEIQDSMMPVEVGDATLRAGLAEIRELVGPLPARAHGLVRVIGR